MNEILTSFSGVIVNTITVLIGSGVGLLLKKGIPEKLNKAVMTAIGLCTIAIGVTGIMKGQNQLVMILSMVFGTIVGTLIDIDKSPLASMRKSTWYKDRYLNGSCK